MSVTLGGSPGNSSSLGMSCIAVLFGTMCARSLALDHLLFVRVGLGDVLRHHEKSPVGVGMSAPRSPRDDGAMGDTCFAGGISPPAVCASPLCIAIVLLVLEYLAISYVAPRCSCTGGRFKRSWATVPPAVVFHAPRGATDGPRSHLITRDRGRRGNYVSQPCPPFHCRLRAAANQLVGVTDAAGYRERQR